MKIGLIGWNGKLNVGDDAMTSVIISYLKSKNPNAEFSILGEEKYLAKYTDLPEEKNWISGFPFINFLTNTRGLGRLTRQYLFPLIFASNKDAIILGGGSIIHREGNSLRLIKLLTEIRNKNPKVKIGAVGVSLGPFENDRQITLAQKILNLLDFTVVRDDRSFELLKKFDTKFEPIKAPDLAFLLPVVRKMNLDRKTSGQKTLGLSLRIGYVTPEVIKMMTAAAANAVQNEGFSKIKIFNFCELKGQKDSVPTERLINAFSPELREKTEIVDFNFDPVVFYEELASCDFTVCMRLHASILSYCVRTPFAIVPYRPKCSDFGKQVAHLTDDYFFSEKDSVEEIARKTVFILDEKNNQFHRLDKVKELAKINLKNLDKVFA